MGKMRVHRIHNSYFLIDYYIGIISHSVGYNILSFKQIHIMIVYAHIQNVLCDFHVNYLFL